jgi:electron transfer flavoprotein alpha subunit
MAALVIAEHDNASIKAPPSTPSPPPLQCGGEVHVLVAGANAGAAAQAATQIAGVSKVLHADAPGLDHGLAESVAAQVVAVAAGYSHILFPATASGKNLAPRVAALLDVARSAMPPKSSAPTPLSGPSTPAMPSPPCRAPMPSRSSPCAPRALMPLPPPVAVPQ